MITVKELENLAELARIKLTENDKQSLLKEFDSIITYVDQIKNVKVPIVATDRVGSIKNVTRLDVAESINNDNRSQLLDEAPDREGDFIAVKKILN